MLDKFRWCSLTVAKGVGVLQEHTTEEVLVDLLAVGFGDEPGGCCQPSILLLFAEIGVQMKPYMIASSWRNSGNRFNRCFVVLVSWRLMVRSDYQILSEASGVSAWWGFLPLVPDRQDKIGRERRSDLRTEI